MKLPKMDLIAIGVVLILFLITVLVVVTYGKDIPAVKDLRAIQECLIARISPQYISLMYN